jgi:phage-related protein
MAITQDSLLMDISVNSKDAVASIKNVEKALTSMANSMKEGNASSEKVAKSVGGMGASFVKMGAAIGVAQAAWASMSGILKGVVGEFADSEKANTKLINSLVMTGNFTQDTFKKFDKLANSIAGVSAASDEQIKGLAAYSLNLGNTSERTEEMIQASQGLSVALGIGIEEAFSKLQGTLTGSAGSLGKLIPGFKNLTEEQLKSGEAIKIVQERYQDFADKGLTGTSGSITMLSKSFNDLLEDIGGVVDQGAGLGGVFGGITDMIRQASKHIQDHRKEWATLVEVISKSVSVIVDLVKMMVNLVTTGFSGIGAIISRPFSKDISKGFADEWKKSIEDVNNNFTSIKDTIISFGDVGKSSANALTNELNKAAEAAKNFKDKITTSFAPEQTKAFLEQLQKINSEYLAIESSIRGIGASQYEQAQLAAQASVNAIGLRIQEVMASKDLLANEKETLTQRLVGLANLALQKADLEQINSIQEQTKGIAEELSQSRMNEFEIIARGLELEVQKLDIILSQVDASTESGKAMIAAINAQKAVLQEKTTMNIDVAFEKSMEKFGNFEKAVGYATKYTMEGMNAGIGKINKSFGTNIKGFKQETVAAAGVMGAKIAGYIKDGAVMFANAVGTVFSAYMKLFDPEFYKGLTDKINSFMGNFPDILGSVMDGLIGAIDNMLANGPAILDNVIGKVEGFLTKFIQRLPEMFKQLGDGLVKIVTSMLDMLPGLIGGLMDALPALIDKIFEAFNTLVDRLPGIVQVFLSKLPQIFESLLSNIPKLLDGIFKAIPQIIQMIVRAIPGLIDTIAKNIGPIIESFISGILGAIGEIIAVISDPVTITKIVVSIIKAIVAAVIGIVKGIISGIGKFFKGLFKGAKFDGLETQTKKISNSFSEAAKGMGKAFTKEGSKLFAVTDFGDGAGKNAGDKIKEQADAFMEQVGFAGEKIKGIWDWIKEGWDWVIEKLTTLFNWIWNSIFKPIIDGLTAVWKWVYENVLSPLIEGIKAVWQWVYDNVIGPLIEGVTTVFTWVKESIFDPIVESFTKVFSFFGEIGTNVKSYISEAFSGVSDTFKNMFSGIKSLFKGDWSGFTESIKESFKSAGDVIMKPFKTVLNGFITILNALKIPGVSVDFEVFKKRVKFDLWGDIDLIPGTIEKFAKGGLVSAAGGGSIPGFGTDTVPAMLTPGEFVMRRSAVQSTGLGMMNAINSGNVPSSTNQTFNFDVEINVDASSQSLDEGYVRQRLIPAMKAELKRASYAGELLISNRGIDK